VPIESSDPQAIYCQKFSHAARAVGYGMWTQHYSMFSEAASPYKIAKSTRTPRPVVAFSDKLFLYYQRPPGCLEAATCSTHIATSALIGGHTLPEVFKRHHA